MSLLLIKVKAQLASLKASLLFMTNKNRLRDMREQLNMLKSDINYDLTQVRNPVVKRQLLGLKKTVNNMIADINKKLRGRKRK